MTPDLFIAYVDDFLATEKRVIGSYEEHVWPSGRDPGSRCIKLPLEIRGEQPGHTLCITAYPNSDSLHFHIGIIVEVTVCRIDFENETHGNNFAGFMDAVPRHTDGRLMLIHGPHYHPWSENRRFVKHSTDLLKLRNAVPLPEHAKDFESAFIYFCQDNNIIFPTKHTIILPPRTSLF